MSGEPVAEQGEKPAGGRLRANRLTIALALGVAETLAILLTGLTWWSALVLAGIIFFLHLSYGRKAESGTVRELSWAAAGSQILPVVVPAIVRLVALVAIVAVVVLALVIAAMLFFDRKS